MIEIPTVVTLIYIPLAYCVGLTRNCKDIFTVWRNLDFVNFTWMRWNYSQLIFLIF